MSMFNFQEKSIPAKEGRTAATKRNNHKMVVASSQKEKEYDLVFHEQATYLMKKYGSCMNVKEIAEELKISKDLVYDLLNKGEIHSTKAGDRRVVPTAALVYWMIYRKDK